MCLIEIYIVQSLKWDSTVGTVSRLWDEHFGFQCLVERHIFFSRTFRPPADPVQPPVQLCFRVKWPGCEADLTPVVELYLSSPCIPSGWSGQDVRLISHLWLSCTSPLPVYLQGEVARMWGWSHTCGWAVPLLSLYTFVMCVGTAVPLTFIVKPTQTNTSLGCSLFRVVCNKQMVYHHWFPPCL